MKIINLIDVTSVKSTGYKYVSLFPPDTFLLSKENISNSCGLYVKNGDSNFVNEDLKKMSQIFNKSIAILDGDIPSDLIIHENILYFISSISFNQVKNIIPIFCNAFSSVLYYESIKRSHDDLRANFHQRLYDVSFLGSFDTWGPRKLIKKLKLERSNFIEEVNFWSQDAIHKAEMFLHYLNILKDTKFSLCPRGFNQSSIRFAESITMGAIPILIDDLSLPFGELTPYPRISSGDLTFLNEIILHISENEIENMRDYSEFIYKKFIQTDIDDDYIALLQNAETSHYLTTNWKYIYEKFKHFA